jgi:Fibrinogen beta and gamma chains, C-terminal globular domain
VKTFLLFLFLFSSLNSFSGSEFYRIPTGSSQYIGEWGLCATVTNTHTDELFISTKSVLEWNSLLTTSNPKISISYSACSCRTLLAMGNVFSGVYSVDPDYVGPLAPINVYCDMDTAGGGWTLVGRSVSAATSTPFGWNSATGSVNDDSVPYSMGVIPGTQGFSEVLFGDYTSGKSWGFNVYRQFGYPKTFITDYDNLPYDQTTPIPIFNGNTNYYMAYRSGFTYHTDLFYFRDLNVDAGLGLGYGGWSTAYNDGLGGFLNGSQGMLMIR